MKGVSAVIAAVLLLMITVSLAAAAYVWFNSTFAATTDIGTKQIERSSQVFGTEFKIESVSADSIYIRNTGTADISNITVFVEGKPANTTSSVIKAGEIGKITIRSFVDYNSSKTIKITSGVGVGAVASIGPSQNYDSLVAHWRFDEGSGTTAADSSSNKNDGAVNGATWTSGLKNSALNFDGVNDYVNIGTGTAAMNNFNSVGFTVEAWVYMRLSGARYPAVFGKSVGDFTDACLNQKGIMFIVPNDPSDAVFRKFVFGAGDGTCYNAIRYDAGAGIFDRWVFLSATFDSSQLSLYIDGSLVSTTPRTVTGSIDNTATDLNMGRWRTANLYFNGMIDEMRVWNRTLSANEIAAHYLSEKP